jgi:hypothetical protein
VKGRNDGMNNEMITDGEKLMKLLERIRDVVAFQETIKDNKVLYDLLQEAIEKLYDCSIHYAEEIQNNMKEWSAKNGY